MAMGAYNKKNTLTKMSLAMHWSIHRKVLSGFSLALVVLAGIGLGIYNNFQALLAAQGWQSHTHMVIEEVKDLVTQVQDAQRGQRGYVITGEAIYLAPYFKAKETIETDLSDLRTLTKDNPKQKQYLEQLEPLIAQHFQVLEQIIQVRSNQGFEDTLKLVRTGQGMRVMNRILSVTSKMEALERTLLEKRNSELNHSVQSMTFTTALGCLAILLILAALYFVIHREIAHRVLTAQRLKDSEERLQLALEGSNDGLWDWTVKSDALYFSPKCYEMLGYKPDELLVTAANIINLIYPDDRESVIKTLNTHLEGNTESYEVEYRFPTKSGEWKWLLARGKVVERDEQGNALRMVGTHTDINGKKHAEEELFLAKETALQAVRLKSQFLANMSHEIRTPMNGVLGLTEIVLKSSLTADQRKNLEMIHTSGKALLTIINDILDFSKIEAGKLELDVTPFRLRETLGETLHLFGQAAQHKQLELLYRVQPDVPDELIGDPSRLRQIINNLVGNAIKFTSAGEILLAVNLASHHSNQVKLEVTVSDTGIGLTKEQQKQIFEPFIQADGSITRRYGGTGLGLSISKSLIELMNGTIWVHSTLNKGSQFSFTVELALPENPSEPVTPIELESLRNLPVLLVDDNDTNLYILKELALSYHMRPVAVNNGQAALVELQRAVQQQKGYPLAILDVNMPEMDGLTLAQKIKSNPLTATTRLIILTSCGEIGDIAKIRKYGVEAYLSKPVGEKALIQCIQKILNPKISKLECYHTPVTFHDTPYQFPKLKILIAEDNEINQVVAEKILQEVGCITVVANNGHEAVNKYKTQSFDLILMDLHMPDMDGLQATATIRELEQENHQHIPIIALTANALKGDAERCIAAGMDGYVAKPFHSKDLLNAIKAAVSAPPASEPQSDPVTPTDNLANDLDDILDREKIADRLGGNIALLTRLIDLFSQQCTLQMESLQTALATQDSQLLKETSHALKGAIGNFTEKSAYLAAFELEKMGEQNDFSQAEAVINTLGTEVQKMEEALRALAKGGSIL